MEFQDEGYIVSSRRYGENSLIINVVTQKHGLINGFIRGGGNKKNLGVYQQGNKIYITAWARLEENMPNFKVELLTPNSVNFMNFPQKLASLSSLCSLCICCLQENENLGSFYNKIDLFFKFSNKDNWLTYYCLFEFYLLEYLGVGLDLNSCADTGTTQNLAYVSPKSGRAVCSQSGKPYADKLYLYPHFIINKSDNPTSMEVKNLLEMTGFFLKKNFFQVHGLKFPKNRGNLLENLGL